MGLFDPEDGHFIAVELERRWFDVPLDLDRLEGVAVGVITQLPELTEEEVVHLRDCKRCGAAIISYTHGVVTPPRQPQPTGEIIETPAQYSI